uniref:Uncharacterized protein n=1 Tax=Plectus sambesii TaxID=2011161 RepID=A0A914WTA7_9BILA
MASSGEDELQNLRPMLVHTDDASNQPSTSSGTGAQRQWFVQMEEGLEDDEDMGESRDPAYERALESYMRGEITYEEFVQTTGVTVDDDDDDDDGEGEEDEDEYVEVDDPSETPSSKKRRLRAEYLTGETAQLLASFKHDSDTMEYVGVEEGEGEDTMDDYEDDTDYQPGASSSPRKRRSQHLQGVASPRILQPTPALAHHRPGDEHRDEEKLLGIPDELRGKSLPKVQRRLPKPLEALLGQANVMHAKGSTQEAIDMLSEVIRQEPRNSESYKVLADIYNDMGDQDKALEYGLLSAHLDYKTPASEWARLGHLCEESDKWDQAAIVYGRAIRAEPANWQYYESRIRMLDVMELTSLAMKTRLAAVQNITNPADFAWLEQLVNSVVEYYTANSDEEKAANALESLLVRAKRRGIFLYGHLDRLVGMWMRLGGRYKEAAQAVFIHAAGDLD